MRHLTLQVLLCCAGIFAMQGATQLVAQESGELPTTQESDAPAAQLPAPDLQSYLDAIAELESGEGAYAPALQEQLLSLGLNLQQNGQHQRAIDVFKRGTHLARINNGLYSAEQIPLLQREITSHIALRQYAAADERQHYLFRVQVRSLPSDESRTRAFIQQADWQFSAYQLDVEGHDFGRLMKMWDLYRLALSEIIEQHGQSSEQLLYPLRGMLRTQYLISSHQPESNAGDDAFGIQQQQDRFHAYRAQSYKKGQAVVLALYDVQKATHGEKSTQTAQTLAMLGDWSLWNGKYESAISAYQQSIAELVARSDAEAEMEQLFGEPVALPNMEGIKRLPDAVVPGAGRLHLSFAVNELGRVLELNRTDETAEELGQANRLMRTLRKTPFRPRFVMGEPVTTENIVRTYDIQ